jgi:hypothetical protein
VSDPPERGETGSTATLSGVVRREVLLPGSRSEHLGPVLVGDDGRRRRLLLVGENALEQPTLSSLDGRRVTVSGVWRNGVLRVERDDLKVEE